MFCTKSMYPYLLKNGKKVLEKGEMMRDIMFLHICPLVKLYIKPLLTFYFLSLLTSTSMSKQYPLLLPTFLVLAFCVCVCERGLICVRRKPMKQWWQFDTRGHSNRRQRGKVNFEKLNWNSVHNIFRNIQMWVEEGGACVGLGVLKKRGMREKLERNMKNGTIEKKPTLLASGAGALFTATCTSTASSCRSSGTRPCRRQSKRCCILLSRLSLSLSALKSRSLLSAPSL